MRQQLKEHDEPRTKAGQVRADQRVDVAALRYGAPIEGQLPHRLGVRGLLALQRLAGNASVSAIITRGGGGNTHPDPSMSERRAFIQRCPETGTPGCDCPREEPQEAIGRPGAVRAHDSPAVQRQPPQEINPGSDVGNFLIRLSENGRIEWLYETPALPVTGPLGFGFRCENGRCRPVGGQRPSDSSNRTYSVEEAVDLLKGAARGPGPSGGAPPGGGGLGLPLPDEPPFQLCQPDQRTPSGRCCPPGQHWSWLTHDCGTAQAPSPGPTLGPLTLPPLFPGHTLGVPRLRLGLPELRRIDHFGVDQDTLPSGANEALDRLAGELNAYPDEVVHIEGHTDSSGTVEHNQSLSERRARSVVQALMERGVDASRLIVEGLGSQRLRNPEERTPEEKAENRRVEVRFRVPLPEPPSSPFRLPGATTAP